MPLPHGASAPIAPKPSCLTVSVAAVAGTTAVRSSRSTEFPGLVSETSPRLPIAVDAMGGDNAPASIVEGAKLAVEQFGVPVVLVGRPDEIGDTGGIPVIAASEVIAMDAEPAASVRKMKDSSIVRAAEAVRDGQASALLSAGNTGASMAASLLRLGRIRGVSRPAIAVPFPVLGSTPSTLLDCGANADCNPEWMVRFAQMGTVYARARFGIESPRVGVMTIGEEAGKGNSLVKETCSLLENTDWMEACGATYVGNMEGGDVMAGTADVIVCDGFTGNIILKSLEGGFDIALGAIRQALQSTQELAEVSGIIDPVLAPLLTEFDSASRGSAALLGTKGVSMIAHGSATPYGIANAIRTASDMVEVDIVQRIRDMVTFGAD